MAGDFPDLYARACAWGGPNAEETNTPDYRALKGYNFLEAEFDGEDTWRTV